jgi:hypothetical protein
MVAGKSSGSVFISYSSRNREVAVVTKNYLASLGIACWMAPESIPPGEQWAEAIARVIPESSIMVLLWTSDSMKSSQVINELTLADRSGVMIIPFRLEEIEPEGAFKYYLYKTHWLDAVGKAWKDKLSILGERVLHNLPAAAVPPTNSSVPVAAASRQWNLKWIVGVSSTVMAAVILVFAIPRFSETAPDPAETAVTEAKQSSASVDLAVDTIRRLYLQLTDRQYEHAMKYVSPDISWQFKPEFFRQFDRVSVQDLQETGTVGSTVNLIGVVNFVWPDGSIQREKRTFSVDTSGAPALLTATEFGGVVQSR